ncbi:hypothetical protein RF11_10948 [Thelohanellus kitauei]|uniref:Uncharacterized protein n=1 Tax=Thelohanellus kitauei TaxID=669202 RepID=A0A0C2MTJ5_THEKT|nr:hypothetical protein RF11_10948 [Thelohanellus kitauei]
MFVFDAERWEHSTIKFTIEDAYYDIEESASIYVNFDQWRHYGPKDFQFLKFTILPYQNYALLFKGKYWTTENLKRIAVTQNYIHLMPTYLKTITCSIEGLVRH